MAVLTGLAWSLFFTSCPAAGTKVKTRKQQTDTSTHFLSFNTCPGDCDLLWAQFKTLQRPLEVGERRAGSRMWREDHTWRRLVVTSDLTHPKPGEDLLSALLAGEAELGPRAPDFLHRLILLLSPGGGLLSELQEGGQVQLPWGFAPCSCISGGQGRFWALNPKGTG